MKLHFLARCPVCVFQIKEPVNFCQRCGCNLLLLVKVLNESGKWKEQGKQICSRALQQSRDMTIKNHTDTDSTERK